MDNETRQLLEELKSAIDGSKKPFFQNIIQSVIVAAIIAIPTAVMIGNSFENRMLQMEIRQKQFINDCKKRETMIDYNFSLIEKQHPDLNFIPIEENNSWEY